MNLKSYFEKAITYEEYVNKLEDNLALHQLHYKKFGIPDQVEKEIKKIKPLNILVLTQPWCGDSLAIVPVVRKIFEVNDTWGMKILIRDENLDLMDRFLTGGGRAIPIFLFLSEDYSLLFKWGPRPQAAQQIFEKYRRQLRERKIEKIEVIKKIRHFYAKDRGKSILEELLPLLKRAKL